MMDVLIKAAAIAVLTAVSALIIKKTNPESAFMIGLIGVMVILGASISMLASIKEVFDKLILSTELSAAVLMPLYKCTAIAVTASIISSISKDSGQNGIASAAEFLGASAAIFSSLPLLNSIMKTIGDLL